MSAGTTFSIRTPLQGELLDFLKSSGFECQHTTELVRDLTCLLASYREEGVAVFPEVFILPSITALASLSPGTQRVRIGETTMNTAATKVLKDCATLAVSGWAVYIAKTDQNQAEFGVFRSLMHSFATSAEEVMVQEQGKSSTIVLIRNRGHLVVELRNAKNATFTASFTSAPASASKFSSHVKEFVSQAAGGISGDHKKTFEPYLSRVLLDILQHCHGTLLAVHVPPSNDMPPETLADGVWMKTPIDLAGTHKLAIEANDAQSLAALQASEALLEGMISSDGVVVFGNNGTILAYRVFLKPTEEEKKKLPDKGGGRRRTYALMQSRLGKTLKAAFFRSQDGDTECEKATS